MSILFVFFSQMSHKPYLILELSHRPLMTSFLAHFDVESEQDKKRDVIHSTLNPLIHADRSVCIAIHIRQHVGEDGLQCGCVPPHVLCHVDHLRHDGFEFLLGVVRGWSIISLP